MPAETSIVIRTLNEAKNLEKLLKGIHRQNYSDWEIVLMDSGSTDGTLEIAEQYGAKIYHIPSDEFTFGRSLNWGCKKACGQYLVFASGHVWPITNNWLGNLVKPFEQPSIAMVYGRQRGTEDSNLAEFRDLQNQYGQTSHILVDEPNGNNGNAAIRRALWVDQPFDELLPGLEDVDWASKAERIGYRIYYAADAMVYHLHEESLRQIYTRYFREAIASKRMFPHNQFSWFDVARGLPYFMVRDVIFAARQKKLKKLYQIPGTRGAQFLGIYNGLRREQRLSRITAKRLTAPENNHGVVVEGPGSHGFKTSDIPDIGPNELLIKVAYVGVSISDSEVADGNPEKIGSTTIQYPLVPGHEFSGVVVQNGSGVKHLKKGSKVAGQYSNGYQAKTSLDVERQGGDPSLKNDPSPTAGGTYAHFLVKDAIQVSEVPNNILLRHAVFIAPLAACISGLRQLSVGPEDKVCVIGAGPLGNLCAQLLKTRGPSVTVMDPTPHWLALLDKYDIDTLTTLDHMEGYDYLIDASEDPAMAEHLLDDSVSLAPLIVIGHGCSASCSPSDLEHNPRLFHAEIPMEKDWKEAIHLLDNGLVSLDEHAAVVRPLEEYQKVWASLPLQQHFKILLSPSSDLAAL